MLTPPTPTGLAQVPRTRYRRWLRRLVFALVLAGVVYLARAPLLRAVASFLVIDDPVQQVDALVPLDGDQVYEQTALLYHDGTKQILLLEGPPNRLVRMEIMPDPVARARREFTACDVPEGAVAVLTVEKCGDWSRARTPVHARTG